MLECWDLDSLGATDLAEGWREVFDRTGIPYAARPQPAAGERFQARAVRQRIGDLSVVDFQYGRGTANRGRREIAATEGDPLAITVVRSGRMRNDRHGGSTVLVTGDAALWDAAHVGGRGLLSPIVGRTLIIPRDRLRAVMPSYERALGPLPPTNPAVRLLVRYLETLARLAPELEAGARLGAANAAIGLMCAALGASVPSTEHSLRAVLLSEARRYIEEHLGDPGLSPASIAQAHAVSVRTLHAAFESTDESVSALIRRRRLNQCYADLATSSEDQVFTIARRWGFPSAAHFSRAFRRQFGVAPRDIRPPG